MASVDRSIWQLSKSLEGSDLGVVDCTRTDEKSKLIAEAKVLYARGSGWNPIPVYYSDGELSRPRNRTLRFDSWNDVQSMFDHRPCDGLGLWLEGNPLIWLDIDDEDEYLHWSRRVSHVVRSLPTVQTSRGRHVICRLSEQIAKAHDLRKFGFGGEVRGGKCLVMVPPSEHRSSDRSYVWTTDLPKNDTDLPVFSLEDLLPFDHIGHKLKESLNDPKSAPRTGLVNRPGKPKPNVWVFGSQETVDDIVFDCLPKALGTRRMCLTVLVRRMKRIKSAWTKNELWEVAKKYVARAHNYTRDQSGKETFDCLVWLHDHFKEDSGLLSSAVGLLPTTELVGLPSIGKYKSAKLKVSQLATLCSIMQSLASGASWYLSFRDAAQIVGLQDHKQAGGYLKALVNAGLLACVDRGTPGKAYGGLAASYIWIGNKETTSEPESSQSSVDYLAGVG